MAACLFAQWKGCTSLLVVALALLVSFTGSSIASSDTFLAFDSGAAEQVFVSNADGSYGSLEDTYQAALSLSVLNKKVADAAKTCKWLGAKVGESGKDIFLALSTSSLVGCPWESLAKERLAALLGKVENAEDILSLYYPLAALALAKEKGWFSGGDIPAGSLASAVKKLQGFAVASSGPLFFGLGAEVAADILTLGGDQLEAIQSWASDQLGAVLKEGKNSGDGVYFGGVGDASSMAVTSTFAQGLVALLSAESTAAELDNKWLTGFTSFLLNQGLPSSPSDVFHLLKGLHALSDNSYYAPVLFQLKSSTISISSKEKLEVVVGTALGGSVSTAKVTLLSASAVGKSKALYSGVELTPSSDGSTFSFDFTSSSVGLGTYDIKLGVKVEDPTGAVVDAVDSPKVLRVRVIGEVTVSNAKLFVLEDDESPAYKAALKFGAPVPASITATHLQKIKLSFILESGGAPFKAQQVFVKLVHKETETSHVYACKWSDKSYGLTLNLLELMEKLYYLSGPYSMEVIVGDVLMANSFVWDLGTVNLDLESNPDSTKQPPKIVAPEKRFGPMKEIEHIMRLPDKRPPKMMSYLFVVLVLVPCCIFLFSLSRLGVNFKGFPSGGGALLATLGFHGGIGATLVLYFLYWLKLDIFTTFQVLFFLGVFTAVAGYHALSYLANSSSKVKVA